MEANLINMIAGVLVAGATLIVVVAIGAYILLEASVIRDYMSAAAENWGLIHPRTKMAMLASGIISVLGLAALKIFARAGTFDS